MRRHQSPTDGPAQGEPGLPETPWIIAGPAPTADQMGALNKAFQKHLRHSPLWDRMVQEFGAAKAEELLGQIGMRFDPLD